MNETKGHGHAVIMRRILSAFAALSGLLFLTRSAHADPPAPVVIVEIAGDLDDPDALRTAIGAELHADAVLPGDPKASSARGTLTIEARGDDKRMKATYRSLGTPVSRTVDLPADPKRARSVAVLLAGNVAREEADELIAKKPAASASEPPPAAKPITNDTEDLRKLRAVVGGLSSHFDDLRTTVGVVSLIQGGVGLGAGTAFLLQKGDDREHTRKAGAALGGYGFASALIGGIILLGDWRLQPYELLQKELQQGGNPDETVKRVELKWAELAARDRSMRKTWGWIGIVTGGVLAAAGAALPAIVPANVQGEAFELAPLVFVAYGGMLVGIGIDAIFSPTMVEQTWHTYRTMKSAAQPPPAAPAATLSRPRFGFSPIAGGGAATVGFTF